MPVKSQLPIPFLMSLATINSRSVIFWGESKTIEDFFASLLFVALAQEHNNIAKMNRTMGMRLEKMSLFEKFVNLHFANVKDFIWVDFNFSFFFNLFFPE